MYDGRIHLTAKQNRTAHSGHKSIGGTVAFLLTVPVLVTALAAPAVTLGVVLGVVGLTLGQRVRERLRRRRGGGGLSPPSAESGRPA
jgi:hypothetical protein